MSPLAAAAAEGAPAVHRARRVAAAIGGAPRSVSLVQVPVGVAGGRRPREWAVGLQRREPDGHLRFGGLVVMVVVVDIWLAPLTLGM